MILAACGGGETATPAAKARVAETSGEAVNEIDPCTILDEDLIRRHFEPGDSPITSRPSTKTHHPLCSITWRKPNADEIEKTMQAKMTEYITAKTRGENVEMPVMRTENRVTLTINVPPSESEEAAAAAFRSAMDTLERGFKDRDNPDAPPRFQFDTRPVDGVADQASWTPGLSQLSVRSRLYVFHVTVEVGDAQLNEAKAIDIAADVASALEV
jgi:hypothetical protein